MHIYLHRDLNDVTRLAWMGIRLEQSHGVNCNLRAFIIEVWRIYGTPQ